MAKKEIIIYTQKIFNKIGFSFIVPTVIPASEPEPRLRYLSDNGVAVQVLMLALPDQDRSAMTKRSP